MRGNFNYNYICKLILEMRIYKYKKLINLVIVNVLKEYINTLLNLKSHKKWGAKNERN